MPQKSPPQKSTDNSEPSKFGVRSAEFGIEKHLLQIPNSEFRIFYASMVERLPGRASERGFILPLSILLVIILGISGMGFMQHDYLDRRMSSNTVDNYSA